MPPRVKFTFDYSTMLLANGTPPAKASLNIYKTELNRMARGGYKTKEELLADPEKAIEYIKAQLDTNQKRRICLSAIFRVLQETPNENAAKKLYYNFFRESIDKY